MSTHYGHTWPVPDFDRLVTYGEFAQRRYAIGKAAVDAARQYREARLVENHERQLQAEQIANQQFANSMSAWANYMHAVNARQPQTVHLLDDHEPRRRHGKHELQLTPGAPQAAYVRFPTQIKR